MQRCTIALVLMLAFPAVARADDGAPCRGKTFTLVVHGGAGAGDFPPDVRTRKMKTFEEALEIGERILAGGGRAVDAVVATIVHLEDSGDFNAGKGAIANKAGFVELDASLMTGRDLNAGAVAAVRTIKNPILAAQAVLMRSEHVLFVDRGAEAFARSVGLTTVPPEYFVAYTNKSAAVPKPSKSGTVGAVALDRCGDLAGGTSTGGYTAKTPGRVGDSPIIGAGTYVDNETCAVSATGWGEHFIRAGAAHDVAALVGYRGLSVKRAARKVLAKIKQRGATGGLIVVDGKGRTAAPFTSKGMMRGTVDQSGKMKIGIFERMTTVRTKKAGTRP